MKIQDEYRILFRLPLRNIHYTLTPISESDDIKQLYRQRLFVICIVVYEPFRLLQSFITVVKLPPDEHLRYSQPRFLSEMRAVANLELRLS